VGLNAVIRRADGKPLGRVEQVKAQLEEVFPGASFAFEPTNRRSGAFIRDGLAIEFYLGSESIVQEIQICIYGELNKAQFYFDKLADWQIEFPR